MSSLLIVMFLIITIFGSEQFLSRKEAKEKAQKQKELLAAFFQDPGRFIGNYQEHKKLLKVLNECTQDEVKEYYQKLRYETGRFITEFEPSNLAPLFEDVALIYYQKAHLELNQAELIEIARKDFNFICRQ